MKKIIAIITVLVLLFSMTSCATSEIPVHTENWGKSNVLETSEYAVKVSLGENVLDKDAPRLHGEGTYVTSISGGAATSYTVTTKLTFEGYYLLTDGSKVPVNDVVTSSVTFKDLSHDFRPLKSEKSYDGKTVKYKDNAYSVEDLKYSSSIEYGEKKATVKNVIDGESTSFETSTPGAGALFIDNEQLYYLVRSFVKTEGASISFSLMNGLSDATLPMVAGVNANSIVEVDTNINGVAQKINTYPVAVRKSSNTETGSTQHVFCAMNDKGTVNNQTGGKFEVDRSRVVKILQQVPYTLDFLEFNLVKYTYGE